ncbi:MAG: BTAD domain-containing putative transcriptional regulator [Acidimicrobiales bacterium]
MPRDQMIEMLWPDEPPAKSQRRFSVALSTARAVLDPEKREASDHYLTADANTVALRTENLQLDVADFLALTDEAEQLRRGGDLVLARAEMERASGLYRGQFLEDDLYEEWSVAMRELCRLRFLDLSRHLARLYEGDGDLERATSQWLRIIESDPYDEEAHLGVVRLLTASRRHGEARRAYRRYAGQMAELGIEAAAFPSP